MKLCELAKYSLEMFSGLKKAVGETVPKVERSITTGFEGKIKYQRLSIK